MNETSAPERPLDGEVALLASIWHRNRLAVRCEDTATAAELVAALIEYVPPYRQLVFCGVVPKTLRFVPDVKIIDLQDLAGLRDSLLGAIAEEGMGGSPLQIVYFGADREVFESLLAFLDRGWVATTALEDIPIDGGAGAGRREIQRSAASIVLLDPVPDNTFLEERIFEDTAHRSASLRKFLIRMKQSEVRLAFDAIQGEIETGNRYHRAFFKETLKLRERTLQKAFEIGLRERRLDLSSYVEDTPPPITRLLKKLTSLEGLLMAVVLDKNTLIGIGRYRDVDLPHKTISLLWDTLSDLTEMLSPKDNCRSLEISTTRYHVLLMRDDYLFGFILDRDVLPTAFKVAFNKIWPER
jgi:hypothetical protein